MTTVPLSLYLHLPWCVRKCPYCDFNSHTAGDRPPRARYLDALKRDLAAEAERAPGRELVSIFLGGGTPSLFTGDEIGRLLSAVQAHFDLAPGIEITMEANPGTVERHHLGGYRRAGVNRLSLGAQSFSDTALGRLGRIHSAADIAAAFGGARRAGFDNINLDLMFALPGQSVDDALDDIRQAVRLAPEHISWYQLTLEPNTVFFSRPPPDLPDDETAADLQQRGQAALAAAGYRQYEISAYAVDGRRCRHNLNYWSFGDYLAAGAGAHGKVTGADGRVRRYRKPAHPQAYMEALLDAPSRAAPRQADAPPLSDADLAFEYLLNALRLPAGFSEAAFSERTGLPFDAVRDGLARASAEGLMESAAGGVWRPSALGLRFLNDLQARFLPAPAAP